MTMRSQAEQPQTYRRRWAVLAVVSAAQFLATLDLWVVNIALPTLQHDFAPATLSDVSWILDVYAIVLAALLLPAGRAADTTASTAHRRGPVSGCPACGAGAAATPAGVVTSSPSGVSFGIRCMGEGMNGGVRAALGPRARCGAPA